MNRGTRNSRGAKSHSVWKPIPIPTPPTDPSSNHNTPVRADVSSGGSVSSSSDEKRHSSGQKAGNNFRESIYQDVTPPGRRGGGWSAFGSGSSSHGGSTRQSTASSMAINASVSRGDKQYGLKSGQSSSGVKDVNKKLSDTVKASSDGAGDHSPVNLNHAFIDSVIHPPEVAQLSGEANTPESTASSQENEYLGSPIQKFDLCPPKTGGITLNRPLFSKNKERRKEKERASGGLKGDILRPGMVLLKNYLSIAEQASILRICQDHGLRMGFYLPSFGDGGKMHLKLMCFGKFWNPETNQYEEVRPKDHAKMKIPPVPREFLELVDRAMKDSQSHILASSRVKNVESILPSVKPDVCLVNYYSESGRLGLHQDKDESPESLNKGISIVSFSIGDSADFLYSDQRDADKADKVVLESGDVLIFGGKSRHIFHGVHTINSKTAPEPLLEETHFRSGRLNLTFRQHY